MSKNVKYFLLKLLPYDQSITHRRNAFKRISIRCALWWTYNKPQPAHRRKTLRIINPEVSLQRVLPSSSSLATSHLLTASLVLFRVFWGCTWPVSITCLIMADSFLRFDLRAWRLWDCVRYKDSFLLCGWSTLYKFRMPGSLVVQKSFVENLKSYRAASVSIQSWTGTQE